MNLHQNQNSLDAWYNSVIQAGQAKPLQERVVIPKVIRRIHPIGKSVSKGVVSKTESFDSILGTVFKD